MRIAWREPGIGRRACWQFRERSRRQPCTTPSPDAQGLRRFRPQGDRRFRRAGPRGPRRCRGSPDCRVTAPRRAGLERRGWKSWLMNPASSHPRGTKKPFGLVDFPRRRCSSSNYITANWDRWSGANVARDGAEGDATLRRQRRCFYEHPAREPLAAQLALIRRVAQRSRGDFVSALHGLDDANLRAAFGDEAPGTPLLSDPVITGVESRLKTVLGVIDTLALDAKVDRNEPER